MGVVSIDVTFDEEALSDDVRAGIAAVLRRIPTTGAGSWPGGVGHVHLVRLLHGGRSGAPAVAQLLVHRDAQRVVRVVKCGSAEEMAQEWTAYDTYVRPYTNVLCARVEAASPGVVDSAHAVPGEFECVVYDHVAQHAGQPDQDVVLLQDVARAAYLGDEAETSRCERAVTTLFQRAHEVFYSRAKEVTNTAASLSALNLGLGPDLVVEVDSVSAGGGAALGTPSDDEYRAAVRYPDQVRGGGDLDAGAMVALNGLSVLSSGEELIGVRDGVSVAVRGIPPGHAVGARFSVYGRVVSTRARARWDRLASALEDLRRGDGGVVAHGVATADPFAILPHVLDHRPYGRVRAVVHGDMNARNVLIVRDQPYLIDYARTGDGMPLLTDFAWLELGLVRDAFASGRYRDLVRLQRWLALACRLLDAGVQEDDVRETCLPLLADESECAAFRILFALRQEARACAHRVGEQDWWSVYVAQTVLAAHRTFKWPDELQGDGALRAGFAVAAVAAEWLGRRPFRYWPEEQLILALDAMSRPITPASGRESAVLVQFVHELHFRDGRVPHVEQRIEQLRTIVVRTWFAREAERVVVETDDRELVELYAAPVTWPSNADEPVVVGGSQPVLPMAAAAEELVLLGGPGAGKTTVARRLRRRLALGQLKEDHGAAWCGRAAVLEHARDIAHLLRDDSRTPTETLLSFLPEGLPAELLTVGAVHLIVDGLDELTTPDRKAVVSWLVKVRAELPRVPVLVCCRPSHHDPEALPFPTVLLDGLDQGQVEDHVIRMIARGEVTPAEARMILDFARGDDTSEDRRTPADVAVLTAMARTGVMPRSVAEVHTVAAVAALQLPVEDERRALAVLESVAEHILETGTPAPIAGVPPGLVDPLRSAGLLRLSGTEVWFARDHQRDYFAARALLRRAEAAQQVLIDRTSQAAWQEPCRILVSLPDVAEAIIARLVDATVPRDPERAGRLLREASARPADVVARFVAGQRKELSGEDTASGAARALVAYGGPEAVEALHAVAADPAGADRVRIAALRGLAECTDSDLLGSALRAVLLDGGEQARAFAARTVAAKRFAGFELVLAELVEPNLGWVVCDAAANALFSLDVHVTASVLARYHAACQVRLLELEGRLPTLVTNRDVLDVQRERVRLLDRLARPEHIGWLLDRRLDFEVGDAVASFLDDLLARQDLLDGTDHAVRLLIGDHDPAAWLAALRNGDRGVAGAALHRLLRKAPELAGRLLNDVGADPSRNGLCALAAALPHLDRAQLDRVERLYEGLLPSVGADRLDGFAAVVCAMYRRDRLRGVRLAWLGANALTERQVPERLCWPWQRALSLSRGTVSDLEEVLATGGTGADLAVTALSSFDFHRDGGRGPAHRFGPAARRQLLARRPDAGADVDVVVRWTLAAATASLDEALPALLASAGRVDGRTAQPVATNRYGLLDRAPLADVLTAIGWLARESGAAHEFLSGLDTSGMHHSVHAGRLVALAYLGDGTPLLAECGAGDPVLEVAARNAVLHWLPGTCSPLELSTPQAVKEWIARRADTSGVGAGEWRTLTALLAEAERRATEQST